jgi:hypothetical protein
VAPGKGIHSLKIAPDFPSFASNKLDIPIFIGYISFKGSQIRFRRCSMTQAYCFKDRKKVEIKNAVKVTLKNGRPAVKGVCPVCGTKVYRIGKS